ncbi:hypothetical protein [Arachidicoccus sp.]|uniref:hypothetical protein n=1 Tax=Arachidicoccus sp. TaxID=1872624 RepID=UPI003D1AF17E
MIKNIVKKVIKKEVKEIKAPLEVLANYLVQQSQENNNKHQNNDEIKPIDEPKNISQEFLDLKNNNKSSTYKLRLQQLLEDYQNEKIDKDQYNQALKELKKAFDIPQEL